jgi:hypothetical protein
MSPSRRVQIVTDYINHTDNSNIDSAHNHVTHDFVYRTQPKHEIYEAGDYDKGQHKEFCDRVAGKFSDFEVSLSFLRFNLYLTVANL